MTFITTVIIQAVTLFARFAPKGLFEPVAGMLSFLLFAFAKRDRRLVEVNIEKVYGLRAGTHFSSMFARQMFRHQILSTLETIRSVYDLNAVTVDGYDEFAKNLREFGQGGEAIIVTGHMGSWELCARFCAAAAPKKFSVLAKPSGNRAFNQFLERIRHHVGASVLWTHKKSLLKDMLSALKRGEFLGFVMDQKPDQRKGPIVRFFDIPTAFVSGPSSMSIRFEAPVIGVYCMRTAPFTYRLYSDLIVPKNHGITDDIELTQKMAESIERKIREFPEQWAWNYKRWRF